MPLHPCTDACRYEEMEAVIDWLRQKDSSAKDTKNTVDSIRENDELRAALTEADDLLFDLWNGVRWTDGLCGKRYQRRKD